VVPSGDGSLYITNDQLQGDPGSLGYFKPSSSDSKAQAIVYLNSTDVEYGAVAIGDIALGYSNAFVKIQSQDGDGMFEYGGFYTDNNVQGDFFPLKSKVPSPATLAVSFCGTKAFMKITSAAGTQKYSYDYGVNFGTGAGLGTDGDVSLDNYRSGAATCKDIIGATEITRSSGRDLSLLK